MMTKEPANIKVSCLNKSCAAFSSLKIIEYGKGKIMVQPDADLLFTPLFKVKMNGNKAYAVTGYFTQPWVCVLFKNSSSG
jgi:hypothetical protein